MPMKRTLVSVAASLGLAVASFGVMGAAAPAAEAGLVCSPVISSDRGHVYTVCKGSSGNSYNEVRAIARCGTQKTYGPWVNGNVATSRAYCGNRFAAESGAVQLR
ncbi:hypothetical protein HDA32_005462 [Spinactinospora alkalitolerans]|uniref:Uncharacterized protein n=1 Tax=Spinactinospora alkalitolerans TaxID=687207 RepID=A0A852U4C6_9ACTN|nr:hypothetical protein [Spinactinospora alkalitolerans]NYE50342.1 hypothetical protein [Spinactinospora alkalitolerans]